MNLIYKKFSWDNKYFITFLEGHKMYAFGDGYYKIINNHSLKAYFGGEEHILTFNADYTKFTSKRLKDNEIIYGKLVNFIREIEFTNYSWNEYIISFLEGHKMYAFGDGYYKIINNHSLKAYFGGEEHILTFNEDYTKFTSKRIKDNEIIKGSLLNFYEILNIGNSEYNTKTINLDQKYKNCKLIVSKLNWANVDKYNDKFILTIDSGKCKVKRTDTNTGWGIDLKVYVEVCKQTSAFRQINFRKIDFSLTTLPERLSSDHFKNVFNHILEQNVPFNRLIINLEVSNFTYNIPNYLLEHKNVIFNETEYCGPCVKLVGSIDIIPNDRLVIVIDDDIIFKNNLSEILYNNYINHQESVCANYTITHDTKYGKITEPNGFIGFIFKMNNNIRKFKEYYKTMPKCAQKIDDTWFGYVFFKLGIPIIKTKPNWHLGPELWKQEECGNHESWFELNLHTDRDKLTSKFLNSI